MRNLPPPPGERPAKRPRLASKYPMDPPLSNSNSTSSSRQNLHHPRTISANGTADRQRPNDSHFGDALRRGHSDGNVISSNFKSKSRGSTDISQAEREALVDMLRQPSSSRQDPSSRAQLAASRAAIMAADRRRRLSEHAEEQSRSRLSNNLSFVHPGSSRSRQGLTQMGGDRPTFGPSTLNSTATPRTSERPLPRRPSLENLQNRRSREITLPRWEPDAGVFKCPICGTTFSFWYRKHHCRKCGRVVCANCSPHRITIPRQFIVHPPEDATPSPKTATNPGVEVVDLTSDDDAPQANPEGRPQSSEYRIDPALGGGQEVRLCNPCVPDPNPLPHLPYLSTTQHSFNPFSRPDNVNQQSPPTPGLLSSGEGQLPTLGGRVSWGRPEYRSNNASRFDGSAPLAAITSSTAGASSSTSRPTGSPMPLSGHSSVYGSAPDQSAHQVSLLKAMMIGPPQLTSQSVIWQHSFKIARTIVTTHH